MLGVAVPSFKYVHEIAKTQVLTFPLTLFIFTSEVVGRQWTENNRSFLIKSPRIGLNLTKTVKHIFNFSIPSLYYMFGYSLCLFKGYRPLSDIWLLLTLV